MPTPTNLNESPDASRAEPPLLLRNVAHADVPRVTAYFKPFPGRPRGGWLIVEYCPYCGATGKKAHVHGASDPDDPNFPGGGLRIAHCLTGPPRDYDLVVAPIAEVTP